MTQRRRQGSHIARDYSDATTSQRCQQPSEAGEARNGSSLRVLEGAWSCQHLDFGLLASRIVRECVSVVLSHQFVMILYSSPRKVVNAVRRSGVRGHRGGSSAVPGSALLGSLENAAMVQNWAPEAVQDCLGPIMLIAKKKKNKMSVRLMIEALGFSQT